MKKYIILTRSIGNMGGGQIYSRNKIEYCEKNEYYCHVFSADGGKKIYIEELKKYKKNICSELLYSPQLYNQKTISKIINWISEKIDYNHDDEIIIESHTINISLWGEILAKEWNCKHFVFLFSESFGKPSSYKINFLAYKLGRGELVCIRKELIDSLFKKRHESVNNENCVLVAACGNSVENVPVPKQFANIGISAITIGIIGRLDKMYVQAALDETVAFTHKHPNEAFEIVLLGGGTDKKIRQLRKSVKGIKNITLTVTDYIYPIPEKLVERMKVCIAASGSARAVCEMAPTISLDVYSYEAIGVLGYDTQETIIKNNKNNIQTNEYLEHIIFGDFLKCNKYSIVSFSASDKNTREEAYATHFEFLKNSDQSKDYYNILVKRNLQQNILALLYTIGGIRLLNWCKKIKLKMR